MPEESPPREECGVFGVWAPGEDVAKLTYFGLYALQHRGQEAAGIAVSDGSALVVYKDLGLVAQVFDEPTLNTLRGHIAIGHCRYSTTGSSTWENAQPTFRTTRHRHGHRARPQRQPDQHRRARRPGGRARSAPARPPGATTDSDLITALLAAYPDLSVEAAALEVLPTLRGAFSLVFMDEHTLYAARDPHGVRPLVLGRLERGWVVASETAALDIVGASFVREIEPGELIAIDERRPALAALRRSRRPRAACSSTSTWPGRTPRSPAGACTRPGSRSAAGWPASTRPRPTWSSRCPSPARRPRSATPRQSGIPYGHRAWSRTPTSAARSSSRRRRSASSASGSSSTRCATCIAGQAAGRRRRLDRARQHPAGAGPDAARGRRARGARADLLAAGEVAVLLRHRLRHPGRADRQRPGRRGDPRARSAPTRSATSRSTGWSRRASSRRTGCAAPASTATTRSRCRRRSSSASTCSRASSGRSPRARPARPATRSTAARRRWTPAVIDPAPGDRVRRSRTPAPASTSRPATAPSS